MAKNCFIYETLNGVKEMNVKKTGDGLMELSGVFGVCGIRNDNKRVYETGNYSKMVTEMQSRIKKEGGIPGELEHPKNMNITLENISHKITDINIDENGVVTGSITLLNTPKGKIAQAIVEGGLPLFISSRATGNVDGTGHVTLEKISTYDLVGTPGFSQAKLHLNENQIAESINESGSLYYIAEKNNESDMNLDEILEKLDSLEDRIKELEEINEDLQEQLNNVESIDTKKFADGIQGWVTEELAPVIQEWCEEHLLQDVKEEFSENLEDIKNDITESILNNVSNGVEKWIIEEYSPEIQNWITEEYSPMVENWCKTEFAKGIQKWVIEEYSPTVENWMNESNEEQKNENLNAIDETLKVLESIEVSKPTYSRKAMITENLDEPRFIQEMPADARVKWDMSSPEVKESITRRAKLYNFVNEGAIQRFWENINFEDIKPTQNVYEGLHDIEDLKERQIRTKLRAWRNR